MTSSLKTSAVLRSEWPATVFNQHIFHCIVIFFGSFCEEVVRMWLHTALHAPNRGLVNTGQFDLEDNARVKNKTASLKYPAKRIHIVNLLDKGNRNALWSWHARHRHISLRCPGDLCLKWKLNHLTIKGYKMTTKRHQMMREMQSKEKEKWWLQDAEQKTNLYRRKHPYRHAKWLQRDKTAAI